MSRPGEGVMRSADSANSGDAAVTREDLIAVSNDFKQHISSLLQANLEPIQSQLKTLADSVKEVTNTAGRAYEMAATNEKTIAQLQTSEKALKDRLSVLELKARAMNIKFRGLPELPEINTNLISFMSTWIASLTQSEGGEPSPMIAAAYRLGAISQAKPNFPRDILIQFHSVKDKDAVLAVTRRQRSLKYNDHTILALLDLPPETLAKRKLLKPITDQLRSKNVRFRWSPTSDVIVARNGAQYRAEDVSSGRTLLEALELPLPAS